MNKNIKKYAKAFSSSSSSLSDRKSQNRTKINVQNKTITKGLINSKVSQNEQSRLHLANLTNTAGSPRYGPSPCKV